MVSWLEIVRSGLLVVIVLAVGPAVAVAADDGNVPVVPGLLVGPEVPPPRHTDVTFGRQLLGDRIEWPMFDDRPEGSAARRFAFPVELAELWVVALGRPEASMRLRAAGAIALAHRRGMPGLADQTGTHLLRLLTRPDPHPNVRQAVAETVIALDLPQAAGPLLARNRADGQDMVLATDPVLAQQDYEPARAVWLQRLNASDIRWHVRRSAIVSLATVGEPRAADALRQLVLDRSVDRAMRLTAAQGLGATASTGLVDMARRLAGGGTAPIADRLIAAAMLGGHSDGEARKLLLELAADENPAVAAVAVERLLQIDAALLEPQLPRLAGSPDAALRALAARGFSDLGTIESIGPLADLLNDAHPDVRVTARRGMQRCAAEPRLRDAVHRQALRILAGGDWRGLVESADLLGRLDHEPAADRLLELLSFGRGEVQLAAAVNLRRLAVGETMPALLAHCRAVATSAQVQRAIVAGQLTQAFQAFGAAEYQPAAALMRQLLPRKANGGAYEHHTVTRAAAAWALGRLYRGNPDGGVAGELAARLNDVAPGDTEVVVVRQMAAVSLGRMGAAEQSRTLRRWSKPFAQEDRPVAQACRWAIHRVTGEPLESLEPDFVKPVGWFLEPFDTPAP